MRANTGKPSPASARASHDSELVGALLDLVRRRGYERRDAPFELSSGGSSHDYVDLRRAVARGPDLELAARAVLEALGSEAVSFEAIGGMTMGADPIAHAVALLSGREWFSVRKSQKGHGRGQRIEGASLRPGRAVVLFEDTVSTGSSMFAAYEAIVETGAQIAAACTLLDRGDAAAARFAALGVLYLPLLTYSDLDIEPIIPAPPDSGSGRIVPASANSGPG